MVRRLFVEKKPGFDVEAKKMQQDILENLKIDVKLRLLNRYDIEGLTENEFEFAKTAVFCEKNADFIYDDLPLDDNLIHITIEYLPGQYDQRAEAAEAAIAFYGSENIPTVHNARVIMLSSDTSVSDIEKIKKMLINPVESRIACENIPDTLKLKTDTPETVETVTGFIKMSDDEIKAYHIDLNCAMTVKDLIFVRDYFVSEKRDPTITELKVIDTYWSDHCRHTTFLTTLSEIKSEDAPHNNAVKKAYEKYLETRQEVYADRVNLKAITLMDIATMGMRACKKRGLLNDLDESEEINACSVNITVTIDGQPQDWLLMFKNETHNHPTEIEPFGGAATCIGGGIRDPLSGRAYVYQAMRITGAGDPTTLYENTLPDKLPQKIITQTAAKGYASYGNQIGAAAGLVNEIYHEGYTAKRMEMGALVAAAPKENVVRERPKKDDVIILLGGKTGRDGCGGATGSSKAHDAESIQDCSAEVQKGNAPLERNIVRLYRNPEAAKMILRCNDFGAGGVSVAIGELADSLDINLDAVPVKYEGLNGTELAISESQERMAIVIDPSNVTRFTELAEAENLSATVVAKVTDTGRLVINWKGKKIVDISREFINTSGTESFADVNIKAPKTIIYRESAPEILSDESSAFCKNLERLEVASQKGLIEHFDASAGAGTVLMPLGGKTQMTPQDAMVAKIPLESGETDDASVMSFGYNPKLMSESPFHGAAFAVAESLSKLAAVGANPLKARLSFQEYFERLGDSAERWGKPTAALLGAFLIMEKLGIPSIGGKDSMSGTFGDLKVPPTLCSFAVSMTKASQTISAELKQSGSLLLLLPIPVKEGIPDTDKLEAFYQTIYENNDKILSASTVKEGGIAAAVAKAAFGNMLGVDFTPSVIAKDDFFKVVGKQSSPQSKNDFLYAPLTGSIIIETKCEAAFENLNPIKIGEVTSNDYFKLENEKIPLQEALKSYKKILEPIFPTKINAEMQIDLQANQMQNAEIKQKNNSASVLPARQFASMHSALKTPRVFIPIFHGTSGEYDLDRAFRNAGAKTESFVIKNRTTADIKESALQMAKMIKGSEILAIPGGITGGDEPWGAGKFIVAMLKNGYVREAVDNLLHRGGLIIGIGNGFHALIKTGLLPYGEYRDIDENTPAIAQNSIGRHVSTFVNTKIISNVSPWLTNCEIGEIHAIPVSHGEGRFVCDEETLKALFEKGQIAAQYVDFDGNPSTEMPYNPNGSVGAVEAITSRDGKILGKMGHSERHGKDCYINVPGNKDQKIFESGVEYFK